MHFPNFHNKLWATLRTQTSEADPWLQAFGASGSGGSGGLTSPVRLGLLLTEEATELMELREEAEGLRFRLAGVVAITRLTAAALALAGVVEGKPIFVTLWTGANNPYLG